jgi:hypothetical protein
MLKPSASLKKPLFGLSGLSGRLVERTQPDDAHVGAVDELFYGYPDTMCARPHLVFASTAEAIRLRKASICK